MFQVHSIPVAVQHFVTIVRGRFHLSVQQLQQVTQCLRLRPVFFGHFDPDRLCLATGQVAERALYHWSDGCIFDLCIPRKSSKLESALDSAVLYMSSRRGPDVDDHNRKIRGMMYITIILFTNTNPELYNIRE